MKSPTGNIVYSSNPKLLKRTVKKSSGKILEEVILKDYEGSFAEKHIILGVIGTKFKVSGDAPDGSGEFFGIPWKWSGWSTKFDLPGGAKLRVLDYLDTEGLRATAEYYSSEGSLISVTFSNLKSVEAKTYEVLKKKLLSH